MLNSPGMMQKNAATFAFVYRIVDIVAIQFCLFTAITLYNVTYNQEYLVMPLVGTISYISYVHFFDYTKA